MQKMLESQPELHQLLSVLHSASKSDRQRLYNEAIENHAAFIQWVNLIIDSLQ